MKKPPAAEPQHRADQAAQEAINQAVVFDGDGLAPDLIGCFFFWVMANRL